MSSIPWEGKRENRKLIKFFFLHSFTSFYRTMEAWMNVYNVGNTQNGDTHITLPFYHISQGTADTPFVQLVKDGFFALAYAGTANNDGQQPQKQESDGEKDLLPFIVDPSLVFGFDTTLTNASAFFGSSQPVEELVKKNQGTTSRTPCAYAGHHIQIPAGESISITSVYGYAESLELLVGKYAPEMRTPDYSVTKREIAEEVVTKITKKVTTKTNSSIFDAYVKQNFLDNVLRGGLPLLLSGSGADSKIFHVFSRIHGDIERDYNNFQIDTTYFSQGPGNFRDVCQNRRLDASHSPFVGDFNIRLFLSLIQADGFNPLTVASTIFKIPADKLESLLDSLKITDNANNGNPRTAIRGILLKPFRPGQFFKDATTAGVGFGIAKEEVISLLVAASIQDFAGKVNC
jgi:hypothetical protein